MCLCVDCEIDTDEEGKDEIVWTILNYENKMCDKICDNVQMISSLLFFSYFLAH